MKRIPLIPTLVVISAVAAMIALGVWQLRRAHWKDALIAEYHDAPALPEIAYPLVPVKSHLPLFRHASGTCMSIVSWRAIGGKSADGRSGWRHIAQCKTGGAEGPGMQVDMGWSTRFDDPVWTGGVVRGIIAPDNQSLIRLVSALPAPGLSPSPAPAIDDIPNNHRSYAIQWFSFAAIAAGIYLIALRRRWLTDRPIS
jgi:surfeit locus 1 family protein